MAVLSADVIFDNVRTADRERFEVINGDIVYQGGYTALGGPNHGTAATQGRILPWADDTANLIPMGHCLQKKTGDTSASPIPFTGVQMLEHTVENLAVTGAAGSFTDVPNLIYAVDDGNYTMTRPTTIGVPIGWCSRHRSAGFCDVTFFSANQLMILAMAGGNRRTWLFASAPYSLVAHTTDVVKGVVAPCHGKILAIYAICSSAPADANCVGKLQLEIGGTDVTGGIVALNFADTVGLKIAGSAVTAENIFHMGDLMDLEVIATDFVAGTNDDGHFCYYIDYEPMIGT